MVAHNWNPSTWEMGEGSKVTAQAVQWRPINLREGGKHDQCKTRTCAATENETTARRWDRSTPEAQLLLCQAHSQGFGRLIRTSTSIFKFLFSFFEHLHLFHVCLWVCILARVEVKGQLAGICSLSVTCVLGSLQAVRLGSECCRPPERLACETYRIV